MQDAESLVEIPDGYRVFNRYEIRPTLNDSWIVVCDFTSMEPEFNSVKSALAYVMAHNARRRDLAKEIHSLDHKYYSKQFDIQNKAHLLRSPKIKPEVKSIMVVKLDEDIKVSNLLKEQLRKSIKSAKYIKTKGSHYEFTGLNSTRD
jgi:ribosomal protein S6